MIRCTLSGAVPVPSRLSSTFDSFPIDPLSAQHRRPRIKADHATFSQRGAATCSDITGIVWACAQNNNRAGAADPTCMAQPCVVLALMTRSRRVTPWGWGAEIYETTLQDRVQRQRELYRCALRRGVDRILAKPR